jgi:hypothetical protein
MQFNGCRATLIPNLETMATSNNLSKLVTIRNQHFWGIWKVLKRFLHVFNCNLNSFSVSNFLFCLCWFTFCFACVDSHFVSFVLIHFVTFVLIHILFPLCWFTFCFICVDSHFALFASIHIASFVLIHILFPLCWFTFCFLCVESHFVSFVDSHFSSFVLIHILLHLCWFTFFCYLWSFSSKARFPICIYN